MAKIRWPLALASCLCALGLRRLFISIYLGFQCWNQSQSLLVCLRTPREPPSPAVACVDALDCSLNGLCHDTHHQCICDKPWTGENCELLDFLPVSFPQGYGMTPNVTSWGGGILYDKPTNTFHLYVSRMTNGCLLEDWGTNSRIDHAISKTGPTGPYYYKDIAIPTFSHNPAPVALPDGTYAIFHIGAGKDGPNGGRNCTLSHNPVSRTLSRKGPPPRTTSNSIHVSFSLDGPWEPLATNIGDCNNPGPWVHANGTIFVACSGILKRAAHIAGPYVDIGVLPISGGPEGIHEDAQIWIDPRGHFHCIYHLYELNKTSFHCENSTVSAHAYSDDGYHWDISKKSPYGTRVELKSGKMITLATKERPKPVFQGGQMTHLVQGVCGIPFCAPPPSKNKGCVNCKYKQWDFTLVSPLRV